jgi:tetratricopeptide (TPR) repeat protein
MPRSAPDLTSERVKDCSPLIFGTGIKSARNPFMINEYTLLIYGEPGFRTFPFLTNLSLSCSLSPPSAAQTPAIINRKPKLLEPPLSHRKQRPRPQINRKLSEGPCFPPPYTLSPTPCFSRRQLLQRSSFPFSLFPFPFSGRTSHSSIATSHLVALLFALLAASLAVMAAQTGPSPRTAEIHSHLERAQAALTSNQLEEAAKEFHAVLALDSRNADAYANLGVIAFIQSDYQNASQNLRKALAIAPSLAKSQALLGICEHRLGDPSAKALLEKSFPKLTDKKLRLQAGMELAGIYDQEGDLDGTASVMRLLVDQDPDNVDILFMAQRVYTELADDTLNKLAILAPSSARMQQVIAERLINDGDLKGAIDHYKKALEIDPHLPGVHFELGEALLQSSPSDAAAQAAAEKEFDAAVKMDGDSARIESQYGSIALYQSDIDGAFAHFSKGYALNPGELEAQLGLGKVLMMRDKPQEAIAYLRMAVASDPLNTEAHYRLALACRKLGLIDEAEKEMRLFDEIKKTKDHVKDLYREMNKQPKQDADLEPAGPQ